MRRILKFSVRSRKQLIEGQKTETRRFVTIKNLRFKQNDTFEISGRIFRITDVQIQRLNQMTAEDFAREGFTGIDEFKEEWVRIHRRYDPDVTFEPEREVLVFDFEPAGIQKKVTNGL